MSKVVLSVVVFAVLFAGTCPPPCPPGQKCGHGGVTKPQPDPADLCAYKTTCRYLPETNVVIIEGVMPKAIEPPPLITVKINSDCFKFTGSIEPEVHFAGEGLPGKFTIGIPLKGSAASTLYPQAEVLAGSGPCSPPKLTVTAAVAGEPGVCSCAVQWP